MKNIIPYVSDFIWLGYKMNESTARDIENHMKLLQKPDKVCSEALHGTFFETRMCYSYRFTRGMTLRKEWSSLTKFVSTLDWHAPNIIVRRFILYYVASSQNVY